MKAIMLIIMLVNIMGCVTRKEAIKHGDMMYEIGFKTGSNLSNSEILLLRLENSQLKTMVNDATYREQKSNPYYEIEDNIKQRFDERIKDLRMDLK